MTPFFFYGPLNPLGYGIVYQNIAKQLVKCGSVGLVPIDIDNRFLTQELLDAFNASKLMDMGVPSVKLWHQFDMLLFPGRGPRIGFPIFELDTFNNVELHHLSSLDAIIVSSEWCKKVISSNNLRVPTHVLPFGVDTSIFYPPPQRTNGPFRFFGAGKWEIRKGHDILIECFAKAFRTDPNVELHLLCTNPLLSKEENRQWANFAKSEAPNIYIYDYAPTQEVVADLMRTMDCGVFPTHAEGWNLEGLECLACGLQLITTNYSAHTQYVNNDNALLIEPTGMELAYDNKWFHKQGSWCTFNKEDLIDRMREAVGRGKIRNELGIATASQFSWSESANGLRNIVEQYRV